MFMAHTYFYRLCTALLSRGGAPNGNSPQQESGATKGLQIIGLANVKYLIAQPMPEREFSGFGAIYTGRIWPSLKQIFLGRARRSMTLRLFFNGRLDGFRKKDKSSRNDVGMIIRHIQRPRPSALELMSL